MFGNKSYKEYREDRIVDKALTIMEKRLVVYGETFHDPDSVANYLKLKMADKKHEVFSVLFLNEHTQLIKYEELFAGTVHGSTVHPRVIAQRALELNASNIILAHNHPSGNPTPTDEDIKLTGVVGDVMHLIDVVVLDHIIVGGVSHVSLADENLI